MCCGLKHIGFTVTNEMKGWIMISALVGWFKKKKFLAKNYFSNFVIYRPSEGPFIC